MSNYYCALIGVADYYKYKKNFELKAPKWMNNLEKRAWIIGTRYARSIEL